MQKYISPNDIHILEVVNNRELDQNYVESLKVSMRAKGFLPNYAIDVFLAQNVGIKTDKMFVCACGNHRTLAAQQVLLLQVLVNVHAGDYEVLIEMMSLDNFKFDPASNPGIGKAFTQKEKRAACTQLLLLPKYFKKTNTALSEDWNTSEANIRRWRKQVQEMLETNSPKLRLFGVSEERQQRLRNILASNERLDSEGEIVKIRKPEQDSDEDTKAKFLDQIKQSVATGKEQYKEGKTSESTDVTTENKNERDIPLLYAIQINHDDVKIGKSSTRELKNRYTEAKRWCRNPKLLGVKLVDRHNSFEENERLAKKEEGYIHAHFSAERELVYFTPELKDFIEREMVPGKQYLEDL